MTGRRVDESSVLGRMVRRMTKMKWPFRASEAMAVGALTQRAVYPGVWMPRGAELNVIDRARTALRFRGCPAAA